MAAFDRGSGYDHIIREITASYRGHVKALEQSPITTLAEARALLQPGAPGFYQYLADKYTHGVIPAAIRDSTLGHVQQAILHAMVLGKPWPVAVLRVTGNRPHEFFNMKALVRRGKLLQEAIKRIRETFSDLRGYWHDQVLYIKGGMEKLGWVAVTNMAGLPFVGLWINGAKISERAAQGTDSPVGSFYRMFLRDFCTLRDDLRLPVALNIEPYLTLPDYFLTGPNPRVIDNVNVIIQPIPFAWKCEGAPERVGTYTWKTLPTEAQLRESLAAIPKGYIPEEVEVMVLPGEDLDLDTVTGQTNTGTGGEGGGGDGTEDGLSTTSMIMIGVAVLVVVGLAAFLITKKK